MIVYELDENGTPKLKWTLEKQLELTSENPKNYSHDALGCSLPIEILEKILGFLNTESLECIVNNTNHAPSSFTSCIFHKPKTGTGYTIFRRTLKQRNPNG